MATVDTSIPFRAFPALTQEMTQAAETGRFPGDVAGTVDRGLQAATCPRQSPGAALCNGGGNVIFRYDLPADCR